MIKKFSLGLKWALLDVYKRQDPLVSVIADFEPVDVDNAADLQAEMNRLGEFWSQHFVLQDRDVYKRQIKTSSLRYGYACLVED